MFLKIYLEASLANMGTFIKSTNSDDTKAVLELLEASHLALEAGKILIEAKEFSAGILKNIINSNVENKVGEDNTNSV